MGMLPRPRHIAKAKAVTHKHVAAKARACSSQALGSPLWACSQGQGMQLRPRQPSKGMQQPRPGHAVAKA